MRYLGGKSRIAKQIAAEINKVRKPGQWVWEPFCGGLSVTVALSKAGPVWATDANPALIALYQAVQQGWVPPTQVSKETWQAAKLLPDSDPMKAFCGFGCSYGGIWFSSWLEPLNCPVIASGPQAGKTIVNKPHAAAAKGLIADVPQVAAFACLNFLAVEPRHTDVLFYLDPPYANTAGYKGVSAFDSALFLKRVVQWSEFADLLVSEFAFPLGVCVCVWQKQRKTGCLHPNQPKVKAVERLYYIQRGSLAHLGVAA